MADTDSNNDILAELANDLRGYTKTNNQLLRALLLNQQNSGTIIQQPAIPELDEFASEADIINKINQITTTLSASKVTE